jgi:hypothetical protein
MPFETVEYSGNCEMCDEHKTDLGILCAWNKSIEASFPNLTVDQQLRLVELAYAQTKLDQRTAQIQGYKKSNIKEIKK